LAAAGNLSPFQRMIAPKPGILRAYNQLSGALWVEDSKLSPKLKNMAYLRASILNGCEFAFRFGEAAWLHRRADCSAA